VSFALACFEASAAPRPKNSASDEKTVLFVRDTQITISGFEDLNIGRKMITKQWKEWSRSSEQKIEPIPF
jgi:hypothetical protein